MAQADDFAFPSQEGVFSCGLTKREWFAAMAMQALLSQHCGDVGDSGQQEILPALDSRIDATIGAKLAIYWADALITELNKKPQS